MNLEDFFKDYKPKDSITIYTGQKGMKEWDRAIEEDYKKSDLTLNKIVESYKEVMDKEFERELITGRNIIMYTGIGGYNLFDESMEFKLTGKKRLYIVKPIRILSRVFTIKTSVKGRKYRLI